MTTIQDRLNRQDWDPEPGDQLIGQIVEITERETQYGAYPLLVVADDEGAVHSIHCLRGGLLWPVVRIRPKVGDRIGIRYDGVTGTSSAHRYVVAFENATETAAGLGTHREIPTRTQQRRQLGRDQRRRLGLAGQPARRRSRTAARRGLVTRSTP